MPCCPPIINKHCLDGRTIWYSSLCIISREQEIHDKHTVYEISTSFKVYTLQKISKRLNLENGLLMGYETPY